VKHCARILDQFKCMHFVFVVKQLRLWPKKLVFHSYRRTKHMETRTVKPRNHLVAVDADDFHH
jgi:hypothetical protein